MVWFRPRTRAAAVANTSAIFITRVTPSGPHDSTTMPATTDSVPAPICTLSVSPRNAIAVAVANSGAVAVSVEATVGPARCIASIQNHTDSIGWISPFSANTQNPAVNQSSARIHSGEVSVNVSAVAPTDTMAATCGSRCAIPRRDVTADTPYRHADPSASTTGNHPMGSSPDI